MRQPRRARRRRRSPTRRCSTARRHRVRLHGHPASRRTRSRSSPARRSAPTTWPGCAGTRPRTAAVRIADVTARWACFALWGPRARDILRAAHAGRLSQRGFPYMTMREHRGRRRAGAGAAGHVRRRAGLGALLPDRVRRRRCGARCGRRAEPHGLVAGGYRAIDTLRLEKGYRVWARRHHARTRRRTRRGSASASSSTRRAASSAATRSRRPRTGGPRAAALPRPGRPALGRARQRAGADRRRGRRAG